VNLFLDLLTYDLDRGVRRIKMSKVKSHSTMCSTCNTNLPVTNPVHSELNTR